MTDITPASEWAAGQVQTLPSGKVVRLREAFPARMLLRTGRITIEQIEALETASKGELDDPQGALDLIGVVCEGMFLEPRVTLSGEPGTVAVDDISDDDQDFVLERALGGAPSEAFPDKQPGDGGGEDGEVLADPPKRPARAAKRKPRSTRAR